MTSSAPDPVIPRTDYVPDDTESRPFLDSKGKPIDYGTEEYGQNLGEETRNQMVFHWFAHALRNLLRYHHNDQPLPWDVWDTDCAKRYRKAREKLYKKGLPSN